MKDIRVTDTGRAPYLKSYDLQMKFFDNLISDKEKFGYLIITEPNPTITKGIRGEDTEIFISIV